MIGDDKVFISASHVVKETIDGAVASSTKSSWTSIQDTFKACARNNLKAGTAVEERQLWRVKSRGHSVWPQRISGAWRQASYEIEYVLQWYDEIISALASGNSIFKVDTDVRKPRPLRCSSLESAVRHED